MNNEELGALVRDARDARGWSQAKLAQEAGVAEGTVTAIEKGRNTRPSRRRMVMDALDLVGAGMPHEEEFPEDVKTFLRILGGRLAAMEEGPRTVALASLYPLAVDATEAGATAHRIAERAREIAASSQPAEVGSDEADTPGMTGTP